MCGIAGIIDSSRPEERYSIVKKMLARLRHRGPDSCGLYNSTKTTIGAVRLSILDIEGGQQPICDSTERFWIVYNGEVFNYIELRHKLEELGIQFTTHSDTEVIVQLFANYGHKCLEMLNGQFAFAIWDNVKEVLFLARDRFGIRPLYYNLSGNVFTFASEIKALFEDLRIQRELSPNGLHQLFNFWACLSPETAFKGIVELPPGHYLIFKNAEPVIRQYWKLDFPGPGNDRNEIDYIEEFSSLLHDSVRLRLRADVEVAGYLSGGLDSTATISMIKEVDPRLLKTFSIRFADQEFDEGPYQEEAVNYFNTEHFAITCNAGMMSEYFPRAVMQADSPLLRTSPVPMLILSELVKEKGIKVVVTGEGADEMIGGYNIFKENEIRRFWARDPLSRIRPLLLARLYPYLPLIREANPQALRLFFGFQLQNTDNPFYSHLIRWNNSRTITRMLSNDLQNGIDFENHLAKLQQTLPGGYMDWNPLEKAQWLESWIFMSGYLLSTQGDRMTMANSVEGRYPFLDHRLVEFLSKLPTDLKMKGLNEKYILKKAMTGSIPDKILKRSKQAYRAPIISSFLSDKRPEYVDQLVSEEYIGRAGIFRTEAVKNLLQVIQHKGTGSEMEGMALTAILSSQLLYHFYIENNRDPVNENTITVTKFIQE